MSILYNKRLVTRAAEMYYIDEFSQKQIAERLGVSRPQVSRLVEQAKRDGIVEIHVRNDFSQESDLERSLIEEFGLADAYVFDLHGLSGLSGYSLLAEEAAAVFPFLLPHDGCVGVMSGKTIAKLASSLEPTQKKLTFVPLVGGISSVGTDWHANMICKTFSEKCSSEYLLLNAPALVSSQLIHDEFIRESTISKVLDEGKNCKLAIVGIGSIDALSSTAMAENLTENDLSKLMKQGAVAAVATSFLNADGQLIETEYTSFSIGQTLPDIQHSNVLAIATGKSKEVAIKAALKSGYITHIITSVETATAVLNKEEK